MTFWEKERQSAIFTRSAFFILNGNKKMIKIYHNPRCGKSRAALKLLEESGKPYEVINYMKEPLSQEELRDLTGRLGIKAEELVRKKEGIFKEKYKGKELSEDEWIEAMIEHPKLMERAIVVNEETGKAVVARPPERVLEIL